jgi:glycosyltransferase involved in cell wall biosynthesis
VVSQQRQGVAAARNKALDEARGSLVMWLDADDVVTPGSVAHRLATFDAQPALEMLVGQYEVFWDLVPARTELWPQPPCDGDYIVSGLLTRRNLPHLDAMTFRRDRLGDVGPFDPSLETSEDLDFWMRAWTTLKWRFVEHVQARQRIGTYPSASRRPGRIRNYRNQGLMLERNRRLLRQHFGSDMPWRHAYGQWSTDFAEVHLQNGHRAGAMRWAAEAAVRTRSLRALKLFAEAAAPRAYDWGSRWHKRGMDGQCDA